MKGFLVGLLVGLVIVPVATFLYITLGFAPVAATAPPLPFERYLASKALESRVDREAPNRNVSGFTTTQLLTGADVYKKNCAVCHGWSDGTPRPTTGQYMFPSAPELLTPRGNVTDDPAGVTYWKVQNGIRLSGMPSFKNVLTDEEIWDLSALLARADKLPPEVSDAVKPPPDPAATFPKSSEATKAKAIK